MTEQSCGAHLSADGHCEWIVWAPRARQVELVLFSSAGEQTPHVMWADERGRSHYACSGISEGQRYAFRLDGGMLLPDPASLHQPEGVHAPSAVWNPRSFAWTDSRWQGLPRDRFVIYELHVGTFTTAGTFAAVIPRLPDLLELGITAIEIMPVGQFPGQHGWGYDGTYWNAVQNSYGGPRELQRLVDACHAHGLAVILDVIYNHLGPEGNYLDQFGPYFTDQHTTPWGRAVNYDQAGSAEVRTLVLNNVRQWIRDFHLDGLRLDAVHAIYDDSRPEILSEIKRVADEEARTFGRPVQIIAESNLNDVRLLDSVDQGGCGLDSQWSDDFHHCVHTLLTGEYLGYYADFTKPAEQLVKALNDFFVYDGCFSVHRNRNYGRPVDRHSGDKFIISIQTHDQVGNRAFGERLASLVSPAQLRMATGLMLLAPNVPMLFMGEEYGETHPFPFFCDYGDPHLHDAVRHGRREEFAEFDWGDQLPDPLAPSTFESAQLSWSWPEGSQQHGLRQLYCDLLRLRRTIPALCDFVHRQARLVTSGRETLVELRRGDPGRPVDQLLAVFNISHNTAEYATPAEFTGRQLLTSEAERYSGTSIGDLPGTSLRPFEFVVFGNLSSSI